MSKPVGPYTPVVEAGGWVVVSGQVGAVDGALVPGGFDGQCTQALDNLRGRLESVGAAMTDVVKTTVFLRHLADYARMNEIYATYFPADRRPARTTIGVTALARDGAVEIDMIAVRP